MEEIKLVPETLGKFFAQDPHKLLETFHKKYDNKVFKRDITNAREDIINQFIISISKSELVESFDLPDSELDWGDQDLEYVMGFVDKLRKTLSVEQIVRAIIDNFSIPPGT
jgi:hypothetical protein